MLKWMCTVAGVLLLAAAAFETYATILRARKRPGPMSETLNRGLWWMATKIAFRQGLRTRHAILSAIGPLLLPLLGSLLILCLLTGFGLIYLPRLPGQFAVAGGNQTSWIDAFYFSGVTLLTIGYGDFAPRSGLLRFTAILEGVAGIALLSLATAYLLTVYGAVERKRAAAIAFYHQAGRGADVATFIAHHFRRGQFIGFEEIIRTGARDLQILMEAHIEHPVIHYFHSELLSKSFLRMLFILLETSTVVSTCLDPAKHVDVCDHPDLGTLDASALAVTKELVVVLNLQGQADKPIGDAADDIERHRRCFGRAVRRMAAAGITIRPDQAAALGDYIAKRGHWERKLAAICHFLGYEWDEISGDHNLDHAADLEEG